MAVPALFIVTIKLRRCRRFKNSIVCNSEVYDFLSSVSNKYGIGFGKPVGLFIKYYWRIMALSALMIERFIS